MVLAQNIDLPSLELKSTCKNKYHRRGLSNEFAVARSLVQQGYRLHAHRLKTFYCEVDFVATRRGVIYIVEVKTQASRWSTETLISRAQLQRLENLLLSWQEQKERVQLLIATSSQEAGVHFFHEF